MACVCGMWRREVRRDDGWIWRADTHRCHSQGTPEHPQRKRAQLEVPSRESSPPSRGGPSLPTLPRPICPTFPATGGWSGRRRSPPSLHPQWPCLKLCHSDQSTHAPPITPVAARSPPPDASPAPFYPTPSQGKHESPSPLSPLSPLPSAHGRQHTHALATTALRARMHTVDPSNSPPSAHLSDWPDRRLFKLANRGN